MIEVLYTFLLRKSKDPALFPLGFMEKKPEIGYYIPMSTNSRIEENVEI
jgi:hypothetical protein